jgi:hypothetical protein
MNLHTGALSFSMASRPFFEDVVKITLTSINTRLDLRIVGCGHFAR